MRQALLGTLLVGSVAASLALIGSTSQGGNIAAQGPTTLAVDTNPDGNTDTSVGSIQSCLSVNRRDTFDIDIVVLDIENLLGWEAFFVYDKSIIEVTDVDVRLFQAANRNSNVIDASEPVPDRDGRFFLGAADVGKATDSGSGVLARLSLEAIGPGVSPASLPQLDFDGDGAPDLGPTLSALTFDEIEHVGDVNGDELFDGPTFHAQIAVDVPCTAATPTPTPADADGDDVIDGDDQCPDTPADAGVDASGCSVAQVDEKKQQTKQQLLSEATLGLNLDTSLDTVVVGGSTAILATFADQNDEPVPGVDITFKIDDQPGSDADLDGQGEVTKTSDAEGVAEATLNVGNTPGEIVVSATAEGETETVTVTVIEPAVGGAASGPASQAGQTPGAEETPGSGGPAAEATPGAVSTLEGGGTGSGQSSGGGGLPLWIFGPIAAGAVALAAGALVAWRMVRDRAI
jgi:hypothetical protein